MTDKKVKIRTSITIDPDLLATIRKEAPVSVSAYIGKALVFYRKNGAPENVSDEASNAV